MGRRRNTYKELVIRINTIRAFCLLGTLSVQVRGIGRHNMIQSVMALKNPFIIETSFTERQDPYVIVMSQDFPIGSQRNMIWKINTMVYEIVVTMSM